MTAYYNEIDPYAAQWLRALIDAGHIAPGVVDERSIEDVSPTELVSFTQCHFFAGVGVWSHALRLAGWPDDEPVWTGSCPCQPFSAAGKGEGFADERHLWPAFFHLIEVCRPRVVFGEQVASKDGLQWLDLVQSDLEGAGYASAAVDLCAAGFGAPHIRQRLYWVADAELPPQSRQRPVGGQALRNEDADRPPRSVLAGRLDADAGNSGLFQGQDAVAASGLGNANSPRHEGDRLQPLLRSGEGGEPIGGASGSGAVGEWPRPTNGHWRDADWLFCRDGKWRPVEPGTFPLAHGATRRVGRLRAYGNAIVPQVAAAFIEAWMKG